MSRIEDEVDAHALHVDRNHCRIDDNRVETLELYVRTEEL